MSVVVASILVLILIFGAATALSVNMGVLALAGSFVVGALGLGLSPAEILDGFPSDLVVTLIGVTYLFSIAQHNGSIDRVIAGAIWILRGRSALMPLVIFFASASVTAIGALGPAAVAMLGPVALRFATQHRIRPLLMGLMVIHGAQAGSFSPISVYGGIANRLVTKAGFAADPMMLFLSSLGFNAAIAAIVFIVLGRRSALVDAGPEPMSEAGAQAATTGWNAEQILTLTGIALLAVLVLFFDLDVGLTAITIASVLALIAPSTQKSAINAVSWPTILLIAGVITYVGILQRAGTVDVIGTGVSSIAIPMLAALLLCYLSGILSAFASSTALLGAVIPLTVPFLMKGQLGVSGVVAAICISTTIVDTSPFSTNGALVVANAAESDREKLFRQLLIYTLLIVALGPFFAWLLLVGIGSL